jgi:hypothetical protein
MKIVTVFGNVVDIERLTPRDIDIKTIAHALSNLCRWGGHTDRFYSVAQHSVIVANLCCDPNDEPDLYRCALLHDATEAYLVDLPRPIKHAMPDYQRLESLVWEVIAEAFGLPRQMPPEVERADRLALRWEAESLFPQTPAILREMGLPPPGSGTRWGTVLSPLPPVDALGAFLGAFRAVGVGKGRPLPPNTAPERS